MKTTTGRHGREMKKRRTAVGCVVRSQQIWTLTHADTRNREHPNTFMIPTAQVRESLCVNDTVKLGFEYSETHCIFEQSISTGMGLPSSHCSIGGRTIGGCLEAYRLCR